MKVLPPIADEAFVVAAGAPLAMGGLASLPPKELEVDNRLPVFPREPAAPPGFSFNYLFK